MSIHKNEKLKLLQTLWPKNALLTTKGLVQKGYSNQLIQKYCQSGWLKRVGVGVLVRVNDDVTWQGGLYALQEDLHLPLHLGGLTVLQLHGKAHYLNLGKHQAIYLYNTTRKYIKLPSWFNKAFNKNKNIHMQQYPLFSKDIGHDIHKFGDLEINVSTLERAILETLLLVPKKISVEHAFNLVMVLHTIRPSLMQELLENCRHVLVKRLFLFLAEETNLPIMDKLNLTKIDLGSGVREILKGGKYYPKYNLVVPIELDNEEIPDV